MPAPPPSSSPAAAPAASTSGPPPRSPVPLVRRLWPVFVAIVVVVLVLSLVASGVFNTSSPNATLPTYSRASGPANQAAGQVGGGPWDLVAAVAYDTPAAVSVPTGTSVSSNCTLSAVDSSSLPANLFLPAFHGSLSSGQSPWWGMIYAQRLTDQVLLVEVLNGTAQALGIGSGSCGTAVLNFTTVPTNVVDSSVIASLAWSQGGSAFVAAHSALSLEMEMGLIGGTTVEGVSVGAVWVVEIDPCGVFGTGGPSGSQPEFRVVVNATTGNVEIPPEVTSTSCSATGTTATPLDSAFAMGGASLLRPTSTMAGCAAGDGCYHAKVETVAAALTAANLTLSRTGSAADR